MEFEPAGNTDTYSDREMQFIEAHIKRFCLNDPQYRYMSVCLSVINNIGNLRRILCSTSSEMKG